MQFLSVLQYAHKLIDDRVHSGDCVIDATVGNGYDTAFLASSVGTNGCVYGFDIQAQALEQTWNRLTQDDLFAGNVYLIEKSHEFMEEVVPNRWHGQIAAIMFNLGYLPGGDRQITTSAEKALLALEAAIRLLQPGGITTIVLYPGHPSGHREAIAIDEWVRNLPQDVYQAISYQFVNQSNNPPYLIAINKI